MSPNDSLPLKKHEGRPDLVGEHPLGDSIQVVLILVFLTVWVTDTFVWHYSTFLIEYVPFCVRLIAGSAVAVPAMIFVLSGHRTIFGTQREHPEVFREGPFSIVRHPLYLGSILSILSMVLYSLSLASAFLWVVIVLLYIYISRYEEKALLRHFGEEYGKYRQEVPMMFPRIRIR